MVLGIVKELALDLPRHSAIRYLNSDSLDEEYFENINKNLQDPHIYLVCSDTGSAASSTISVFTKKTYNHISIAFDKDLQTLVSYNGGEKVNPPGLNGEKIEQFNKKEDSSALIYKLSATAEQKKIMAEKIREINEVGSAYNILGLIIGRSLRPNIMFCSQFVYQLLKSAELTYFDKKPGSVKPTDFIELDYERRLTFYEKIILSDTKTPS